MFSVFLLAHLMADFILQPYWLVVRKRYWDGLLIHGSAVLGCMILVGLLIPDMLALWPVMLGVTAVHVAADWWKIHRCNRLFNPPIVPFLIDQGIHVLTLVVALSLVLPAEQIWTLAQPAAPFAVYASAYIIAAFATPIAVMIWLDPQFTQASLSLQARVRSLILAAVVISLTLTVGVFMLPLTLFVMVLIIRYPPSNHPLDMPLGVLTVLCVSTTLAALLSMLHA